MDRIVRTIKSEGHTSEEMDPIIHIAKVLVVDSNIGDDNITGED